MRRHIRSTYLGFELSLRELESGLDRRIDEWIAHSCIRAFSNGERVISIRSDQEELLFIGCKPSIPRGLVNLHARLRICQKVEEDWRQITV
jgi:hypothetical protein